MCNSLNPAAWYEQNQDFNTDKLVILANPLSSDLNAMRQSLIYGGLSSVSRNINRQNHDLKFYEFGNCYFRNKAGDSYPKAENYSQKASLDLFITGAVNRQSWNSKSDPTDFFNIKSAVEMILSRSGIKPETLTQGTSDKKYFAESLSYLFNGKILAEAGRISKSMLVKFDIDQDVYYSHIEWDTVMKLIKLQSISFRELPKYPISKT